MMESSSISETKKTGNVGIIYTEESGKGLTHPLFGEILNGFKTEMDSRGYDITFVNRTFIKENENLAEHCRNMGFDGVCLVCVDFSAPGIQALVQSGIPCVTVDHIFRNVPAVLSDNETGVQKLVEFAISRGHRRIAFIHGHNNSIVTRTRIRQFYNTMEFYNLSVPENFVRDGLYHDINLTRRIVSELLSLPERPTCILLPDDLSYLGAQEAARDKGLRIPDDISFTGYDGMPLIQALSPRLTTIHQKCDQLGKAAAEKLIKSIENPGSRRAVPSIFPVDFIEGETIGFVS